VNELTVLQISLSTADDEANYFTGIPIPSVVPDSARLLPAGTYRIIDGQLCRILPGVSPRFTTSQALAAEQP
jgi:hypothetical protein